MRSRFIQSVIDQISAESYLEIGTQYGYNFNKIRCKNKVGVDPENYDWYYLKMTSDDYFEECEKVFDVIFIDGLHHADQVIKDVENSLKHVHKNSIIILHDCNPRNKEEQEIPEKHLPSWTGNVWRAWLKLRTFKNLNTYCIDLDTGMGFVALKPAKNNIDLSFDDIDEMTYEEMDSDRKKLLNLKTENYFKNILKSLPKI